jgi:hypothetical protein
MHSLIAGRFRASGKTTETTAGIFDIGKICGLK